MFSPTKYSPSPTLSPNTIYNTNLPTNVTHHYYTYHGLLDPSLNIPLHSHNLKSFCSVYERRFWRKRGRKGGGKLERKECDNNNNNKDDNDTQDFIKRGLLNDTTKTHKPTLTSTPCPQVHLVNGQIQVLESSLTTPKLPSIQSIDEGREVVSGEERTGYWSFRKKIGREKWSVENVRKFYELLRTYGLDFDAMAHTGFRTKKQLKAKYKIENKKNSSLIDAMIRESSRNKHVHAGDILAISSHEEVVQNASSMDTVDNDKIKTRVTQMGPIPDTPLSSQINQKFLTSHPDTSDRTYSQKVSSEKLTTIQDNMHKLDDVMKDLDKGLEVLESDLNKYTNETIQTQPTSIPLMPHLHIRSHKTRPRIKPKSKGKVRFMSKVRKNSLSREEV